MFADINSDLRIRRKMLQGEIKPGDKLIFPQGDEDAAKIHVISVLLMHGERVVMVSINQEPPVHIDEELLRKQCVRYETEESH